MSSCSPQECLGLPNMPKLEEIVTAYRKLSRALHPDRNLERQELAEMLMKSLTTARMLLENQLKK